jgi:hypothetical protein
MLLLLSHQQCGGVLTEVPVEGKMRIMRLKWHESAFSLCLVSTSFSLIWQWFDDLDGSLRGEFCCWEFDCAYLCYSSIKLKDQVSSFDMSWIWIRLFAFPLHRKDN